MTGRLTIALLLVLSTAVLATRSEPSSLTPQMLDVPYAIGNWTGSDAAPLDPEVEKAIAADQILNRDYASADGRQSSLYVAYYAQQRPGVSIHSPLLCLPGTGWDVLANQTVPMIFPTRSGEARRLIARKEGARAVVLYWYDIHGRMIANDLTSRLQLFSDRLRLGRNDAALVRVVVPVTGTDAAAERSAHDFISALVAHIPQ